MTTTTFSFSVALGYVLTLLLVPLVLARKRDATSAIGWCLAIIFVPYVGGFLFLTFGNTHIERPLSRKRRQRMTYLTAHPRPAATQTEGWRGIAAMAGRLGAFPARPGNAITHFQEGCAAYRAMEAAIEAATAHIYLEFFIWQPDHVGRRFIELLAARARAGVEVYLLYDAMGSYRLRRRHLRPLLEAGGHVLPFLSVSLWRRRIQVSLRNHRKILTVDGRVGFLGGLNIGGEYVHESPYFGFWRDTHLRLDGPAVADLERVFIEDWHFASEELLPDPGEPVAAPVGPYTVQIVSSGPDQESNSIHEIYFAAMARSVRRLWIASPYFIPDASLIVAMQTAARMGVDVRLLCQKKPDKWLPYLAAHYYWEEMMEAGVRIYRYTRGMMHSKVILVDGEWASVGTANWDVRSLRINFEVNALVEDPAFVGVLERQFLADLNDAEELELDAFLDRPRVQRIVENVCRLFSPVL